MLTVVVPPAYEPITLAEAKGHLRVDIADDDDLILGLISSARQLAETITRTTIPQTTWQLLVDSFPGANLGRQTIYRPTFSIPCPPLASVVSISYRDAAGSFIVIDPATYQVVPGVPGKITPALGHYWPTTYFGWPYGYGREDNVLLQFVAGYPDAASVPAHLKSAIKLLIGHWYEHREAASDLSMSEVPMAVGSLLSVSDWGHYA